MSRSVNRSGSSAVQVVSSIYSAHWLGTEERPPITAEQLAAERDCFLEELAPVQEPTCPSAFTAGPNRDAYNVREYDRTARNKAVSVRPSC